MSGFTKLNIWEWLEDHVCGYEQKRGKGQDDESTSDEFERYPGFKVGFTERVLPPDAWVPDCKHVLG